MNLVSALSVGLKSFPKQTLIIITDQTENEVVCRRYASSPSPIQARGGILIITEGFRLPVSLRDSGWLYDWLE